MFVHLRGKYSFFMELGRKLISRWIALDFLNDAGRSLWISCYQCPSVPNRRWIFYSNRNDCLRLKKSSRNTNHNCFKVECGYISGKLICVLKHNWKETEMQNAQVWVWKCERRKAGNNDDYDNYWLCSFSTSPAFNPVCSSPVEQHGAMHDKHCPCWMCVFPFLYFQV